MDLQPPQPANGRLQGAADHLAPGCWWFAFLYSCTRMESCSLSELPSCAVLQATPTLISVLSFMLFSRLSVARLSVWPPRSKSSQTLNSR